MLKQFTSDKISSNIPTGNIAACFIFFKSSYQGAFKNGVANAFLPREATDFTGFSGTFQDTAVARKKDLLHAPGTPHILYFFSIAGIKLLIEGGLQPYPSLGVTRS